MFATSDDGLKYPTTLMKMHPVTNYHQLIALMPYGILLAHVKLLDEQIYKLLNTGITRHSTSLWSIPVALVRKKEGGL